jgi:hypothetical protein
LWVGIPRRRVVLDTALCYKVCLCFFQVLWFPPPIKLTATYNWNIHLELSNRYQNLHLELGNRYQNLHLELGNRYQNLHLELSHRYQKPYGCWIYNYLCNQCLSPLTLWVGIPRRRVVLDTALCYKVCLCFFLIQTSAKTIILNNVMRSDLIWTDGDKF